MISGRTSPFRFASLALAAVCVFTGIVFAGPDSRVGGPNPGDPPVLLPGQVPWQLQDVGIDEHLGRTVDLGLTFTAENGQTVKLGDYFNQGRPVILDLVYYKCPMLCTLILNAQTQTMRDIAWTPGKEYEVVTISIDPRETADVAREKKAIYLSTYDRPAPGWHFLVDKDGNAKKLAEQLGDHYRYDEKQKQFAHASAIMILTPSGKISRYLYGIHYPSRDVRFALTEAAEGNLTLTVEKILLFCYHYDPQANRYVLFAMNVMRTGGVLTVLLISFMLWRLFRADRIRTRRLAVGLDRAPNHREGIA
jgi:protein SCO1/2